MILVNAAHAKGLPGRKTDVADAVWLCQLGECGLLKASYVPPEPIRHLTRYRSTLAAELGREAQRLEKELEDAGIKMCTVATDILGVSGRAMLTALIDGERDASVLAQMAKARMRPKIPALVEALTGNFGEHHAFLCRLHLERIDQLKAAIADRPESRRKYSLSPAGLSCWRPFRGSAAPPPRSSWPRPAPTWPASAPPGTWPPGQASAPATTNPPGNTNPAADATATDGSEPLWAPPPWPPPAPARPPTSAPATTAPCPDWARRKPWSPSPAQGRPQEEGSGRGRDL